MAAWLDRLPRRIAAVAAAATLALDLGTDAALAQQADTAGAKPPVVITQADIDAVRAMLPAQPAYSLDYLNSLTGATIRPDGTVVGPDGTVTRSPAALDSSLSSAAKAMISDPKVLQPAAFALNVPAAPITKGK